MMKQRMKIFFVVILFAGLLLSSCGISIGPETPTQSVDAIYTAAAQTIAAKPAIATSTPVPSATVAATSTLTTTPAATFTSTPVPPTSITNNYCDNSIYLADVTIPDKTLLSPEQAFDKTWSMQNTGTCTWTTGYTIIFSNGDMMSGNTRPLSQTVAPQEQVNVSVHLIAPSAPGTYNGYWRLANSKGQPFGQTVNVMIIVAAMTGTVTVTPPPLNTTQTPVVQIGITSTRTATITPTTTETRKP